MGSNTALSISSIISLPWNQALLGIFPPQSMRIGCLEEEEEERGKRVVISEEREQEKKRERERERERGEGGRERERVC